MRKRWAAIGLMMLTVTACGAGNRSDPGEAPVDIRIAHDRVTPTNAVVQGKVGRPVDLRVDSDATDQLHVHSTPEQTFDVKAQSGQRFTVTPAVPGSVEIELHHLDRTVVIIRVQP